MTTRAEAPDHHCHAYGCDAWCPPEHLMCRACWSLVPREYQLPVYQHFDPRQCRDVKDRPAPTDEWHVAADMAIAYVAWRKGLWSREKAEAAVLKSRERHGVWGPL
jgi:hypothetical protein